MADEVYDEARARNLEAMLSALAHHILDLEQRGELRNNASELLVRLGDCRSELFHYEVRATYDTPEIAEHRRIVADAEKLAEPDWMPSEWTPDDGDEPTW